MNDKEILTHHRMALLAILQECFTNEEPVNAILEIVLDCIAIDRGVEFVDPSDICRILEGVTHALRRALEKQDEVIAAL